MDTTATNRRLRVILTAISNKTLIPRPEFQRRLVWSNKDKVQFIKTVLDGYPFPEIYIAAGKVDAKTGEGSEMLVDGQQRMTTLYQYFKDSPDIKIPKDMPRYHELEEKDQLRFLEYTVVIRDLGNLSIEEIKNIFQKINSTNYGLNAMEIHNSRYNGSYKKFAEKFAMNPFFENHKIFSASDIHRMKDVLFCLGITTTILSTYFNRDSEIEKYLDKYNETFPMENEVVDKTNKVLDFIDKLNFNNDNRVYKKGDFFSLFVELYRILKIRTLDVTKTRVDLELFYNEVDLASTSEHEQEISEKARIYYKASLQAVNDRGSRITRGNIISEILTKVV